MATEWNPFLNIDLEAALRGLPEGAKGHAQPTDLDVWMITVVYEFVAAQSSCQTCSSELRPRVRVVTWPAGLPSDGWRVSVVARCAGWRRHPHVAKVARPSGDLVLGPLARR